MWKSSGLNPSNNGWGQSMGDFNRVVNTDEFFEVPVDYVITNRRFTRDPTSVRVSGLVSLNQFIHGQIPDHYKRGSRVPRGFTVLYRARNVSPGNFDESIWMFDGNEWVVKYRLPHDTERPQRVVNYNNGQAWGLIDGLWVALRPRTPHPAVLSTLSTRALAPRSISRYRTLLNTPSVEPLSLVSGMNTNINSAVSVEFAQLPFSAVDDVGAPMRINGVTDDIATLMFKFPIPVSSRNIGEQVGDFYRPGTFNLIDNHVTPSGGRGYGQADSDNLGRINSINFAFKVNDFLPARPVQPADLKVRVALRDIFDHMVIQDFTLPHNNKWELIILEASGFRPYRALTPQAYILDRIIPAQEEEALDEFQWFDIKDISWTYMAEGKYDDAGRRNITFGGLVAAGHITLSIDAFHFGKELIVTTPPVPSSPRNIEHVVRVPGITVDSQARSYIESELERERFPRNDFVLDVRGRFDIRYGDRFIFKNPEVVPGDGSIELVAYSIEHSYTDKGELRTRIFCGRRFT